MAKRNRLGSLANFIEPPLKRESPMKEGPHPKRSFEGTGATRLAKAKDSPPRKRAQHLNAVSPLKALNEEQVEREAVEGVRVVGAPSTTPENPLPGTESRCSATADLPEELDGDLAEGNSGADGTVKRMSLYLDADLYWRIREYAHRHRTRMHPIIVRELKRIMNELEAADAAASR